MLGEPTVLLTCDVPFCQNSEELRMTALARGAYDERSFKGQIAALGWKEIEDNQHICPDCQAGEEEDNDS